MKTRYYFIHSVGLIDPVIYGPFPADQERDSKARDFHNSKEFDTEDDAIFWLDVQDKTVNIGSYTAGFFMESE